MKKIIAVLLIVMLALCPMFSIGAFAEDNVEVPIDNNLPDNIKDFAFWGSFLSSGMAASDINAKEIAEQLAQSARYLKTNLNSSKESIFIYFDFDNNEDCKYLLNGKVLKEFANKAYAIQSELVSGEDDIKLVSANHIAGEIWLHLVGYIFSGFLGGDRGLLRDFHTQCRNAEININENRVPSFLIEIIGKFFMSF